MVRAVSDDGQLLSWIQFNGQHLVNFSFDLFFPPKRVVVAEHFKYWGKYTNCPIWTKSWLDAVEKFSLISNLATVSHQRMCHLWAVLWLLGRENQSDERQG